MEKVFDIGAKLFFNIIVICLISYIYFISVPTSEVTLIIGITFCFFYFGINFYIGYKYDLTLIESLMVGIIGCGLGIFLYFFSLYVYFCLHMNNTAIWLIEPYFIPTMSIIKFNIKEVTIQYPFILMSINILLVIFGSIAKKIMNKLSL